MTLEEIVKYIYWWSHNSTQDQIKEQLGINSNTGVDWHMFCREVCEIIIMEESKPIGGPEKVMQIDESKIGKRKYHHGHRVEGQWVFGEIQDDSRDNFIFTVKDRSEDTLILITEKWIAKGTKIISDCWKSYNKLCLQGCTHETVNHSKEYKNKDGFHTNKIEGHWRQMKSHMPQFERKNITIHHTWLNSCGTTEIGTGFIL